MCLFCKIVDKTIAGDVVLENEKFLAFKDIAPKCATHVLAIPKTHYKDFNDLPSDVMAGMTDFVQEVVEHLGIKNSGYRLITNIGEDGCQEVPHFHFHILGGQKLSSSIL